MEKPNILLDFSQLPLRFKYRLHATLEILHTKTKVNIIEHWCSQCDTHKKNVQQIMQLNKNCIDVDDKGTRKY